jgi:1-aminocyclopropane-1-carboxylate deaminase/D-cysteine desulfhydrase-like pyridoxal-dependent ACC family enzyme
MDTEHYNLTPVEKVGAMYFKREDLFAPLGYGGINGSKLRQLYWLINEYRKNNNPLGVVSGAVSGSPQHIMAAAICKQYGLEYIGVVGGNTKENRKLNLAKDHGASFIESKCGYAKSLNSFAEKLCATVYKGYFHLETNIVVNAPNNNVERIQAFHSIGAAQVQNIPENIDTLILPCGSATSSISVFYGLYKYRKFNIKKVVLMGIGSIGSRDINFINERLFLMAAPRMQQQFEIVHYNLNGTGYCTYEDLMPAHYEGIEFHPRYEGKCINYLLQFHPEHFNEHTLFWIVGSEAKF